MQRLSPNQVLVSDEINVSKILSATLFLNLVRIDQPVTDDESDAISVRIEGTPDSTSWFPIRSFVFAPKKGDYADINGTVNVGATSLPVITMPTDIATGQRIFIRRYDPSNELSMDGSEFGFLRGVDGPLLVVDPTRFAHTNVDPVVSLVYNHVTTRVEELNLESIYRIRVVLDASASDNDNIVEITMTRLDTP